MADSDCSTCYVKLNISGVESVYCEDNIPTVMQITQDAFELEGLMSNDQCNLSMIWRQVPADETCCQVRGCS